MPNVHAEYYLIPNSFELDKENSQLHPDFDFYGVNDGIMTSIKTLNGNTDTWYRFEFDIDGSNCGSNIDSNACYDTIHAIEDGGLSSTIYGSFQMCVSKPQFHWEVNWTSCNDNCLKKSQDLIIINNSYQTCTLGLYNTETGGNLENDGYLVTVYFDIAKWQYIEGAYSGVVNGRIYLHNDSDSILYYKFVNNVFLTDMNISSLNTGYGIFNHDYSNPDVGGETFLNDGTCVRSYNKLNVYDYPNNWNRETETFTFNNSLNYEKLPGTKNLFDNHTILGGGFGSAGGIIPSGTSSYNVSGGEITFTTIDNWRGIYTNYYIPVVPGTRYSLSYDTDGQSGYNNNIIFYDENYSVMYRDNLYTSIIIPSGARYVKLLIYNNNAGTYKISNVQFERGYKSSYQPYGGYYIEYDNLNMEMGVFHYYDTNLISINNIYVYLEDYEGDTQLFDMVNCRNNYVCKYEDYYSFTSELLNIFNPEKDKVKKLKFYFTGSNNIYFKNPYLYDLYEVPGRATWKDYYQPYGEYICSNVENGTFYNAQTKKVYYNPDNPPKIVSSNPNGQSQNIFGIEVDFYGLSSLFSIPIDIYNSIRNGEYNSCTPINVPFPYFDDKELVLPCMTSYAYERFPSLLSLYRVIMYGIISVKIGVGTIRYIKKWYDGTIEGGD